VLAGVLLMTLTAAAQSTEPVINREAAPDPGLVTFSEVATGLANPLYLTHANDGSGRLFVLEQAGMIYVIKDGQRLSTPFLDLTDIVSQDINRGYSERGLLGLAFHPGFAENGQFFVNYTDRQRGATHIARYTVAADNPDAADPTGAEILFTIDQPYPNHNGGHMDFGPDGYLYVSLGDGGAAGDPLGAGQNLATLLGKIIRIDVDGDAPYGIPEDNPFVSNSNVMPEIWAYGVRNPWRFSFDRATGDLYMGDVGQNVWEEINFQPADSAGGENYGWNVFEASYPYATGTPPENMVYPIAEYRHEGGSCSVTGGYVYRGEAIADLQGAYLFGDFCSGQMWATYRDLSGAWQTNRFLNLGFSLSSFGEDEAGELYIVDYAGGRVLRMVPVN
jgi:glucose/arabinose dehydrogenase